MGQITGKLFSPCFMTVEEYEEAYKKSTLYIESSYMDEYRRRLAEMSHIADIAKLYILKNWKRVTDWGDLKVEITHGPTGEVTYYYNHLRTIQLRDERRQRAEQKAKERGLDKIKKSTMYDDLWARMEERDRKKHNPIVSVNKVVLDPTDGDFSITINGTNEHWWIGDEEIIIIADYIEQQLKKETLSEK